MAHIHGFFPGEFCLFEDLESRGEKKKDITRIILMWLHEGIKVQIRNCTGKQFTTCASGRSRVGLTT